MAFQIARRRRAGFRPRFARRKRQGAWHGVGPVTMTLTRDVASSIYLWSDVSSERLNMAGKGVHERTLLWAYIWPGDIAADAHFAWSVHAYETDAAGNVPTGAILRPFYDGTSLMERMPLDYGIGMLSPRGGSGVAQFNATSFHRDIRVKRKLDDTSAILLTLEWSLLFGTTSLTQRVTVAARTYVSW